MPKGPPHRYVSATGFRTVRLRPVDDDMCRSVHVGDVAFRLVTPYRGLGTRRLAPGRLAREPHGRPLDPSAIREFDRGAVAIPRGGKGAAPERPGLPHRSPPIAGSGVARLFLAIDEIA